MLLLHLGDKFSVELPAGSLLALLKSTQTTSPLYPEPESPLIYAPHTNIRPASFGSMAIADGTGATIAAHSENGVLLPILQELDRKVGRTEIMKLTVGLKRLEHGSGTLAERVPKEDKAGLPSILALISLYRAHGFRSEFYGSGLTVVAGTRIDQGFISVQVHWDAVPKKTNLIFAYYENEVGARTNENQFGMYELAVVPNNN